MARIPGKDTIYAVGERIRSECLQDGTSLIWGSSSPVWTVENLDTLWDAFIGNPDEGNRNFLDKWRDQLGQQPQEVRQLAADVLTLYLLYPSLHKPKTKETQVAEVAGWADVPPNETSWTQIEKAFAERGIGHPGMNYTLGQPWQLGFYVRFARRALESDVISAGHQAVAGLADEVLGEIPRKVPEARHIILHLMYPEHYERVVGRPHREMITSAFGGIQDGETEDIALARIRRNLSEGRDGPFDFYDQDIRKQWDPQEVEEEDPDESEAHTAEGPRVWVECTIVRGRPDREDGPYAIGEALWSPTRNKNGADIYRFMRDVQPGDVVLHLTDKQAITRVSRAAESVQEFGGVPDTEWGLQASYLVPLEGCQELDPPLHRNQIFKDENLPRLREIQSAARHPVFYQKNGDLRQGAYLTPAPDDLVALLNQEYQALAGRSLVEGVVTPDPKARNARHAVTIDWLIEKTLWTREALDELIEVLRSSSPQVVLAGPPGTGKTWVAKHLARFLVNDDPRRHQTVQFHPSFGYEEFIEGLRPVSDDGAIKFEVEPGVVLTIANGMAEGDSKVLIIDEMNRANLPRVFGELMYLFEYRDEPISLQYTRSFQLPRGLSFIGTMNTADRSIRSIDIALRRRFDVFECQPDLEILERFYAKPENANEVDGLLDGVQALNTKLSAELDRHHTIGQTFFMHDRMTPARLRAVWDRKLKPLVEEYFFDEPDVYRKYQLTEFWPAASAD